MPRIAIPLMLTAFSLMTYHIFRLREERELAWDAAADAEGRALKAELELEGFYSSKARS